MAFLKALYGSFLGTMLLLGSSWQFNLTTPEAPSESPFNWRITREEAPLRELAAERGRWIGTAIHNRTLDKDADYRRLIAREFNMATAENAMKFKNLQPQPGRFRFERADRIVSFALANGMAVRGHTLIWHGGLPDWIRDREDWPGHVLGPVLDRHIRRVVGYYRGHVRYWDVVNEAVPTFGDGLRETVWQRSLGDDYIARAFDVAHAADPEARLFYNDFLIETVNDKSDRVYELVRSLLAQGVPIHGVGLQAHLHFEQPSRIAWRENLARFAELGLEIHLTEIDLAIPEPVTVGKLRKQAIHYRRLVDACLEIEACTAMVLWGPADAYSWVPRFFRGYDAPLPFGSGLEPKLAYWALHTGLAGAGSP